MFPTDRDQHRDQGVRADRRWPGLLRQHHEQRPLRGARVARSRAAAVPTGRVAAISADAIAGEANLGTLRYLLAVPAGRTRLLAVKFAAIIVFALVATLLVAVIAAILGLILFGGGPFTTLSGTTISFGSGALRVLLVCLYVTVMLAALGAVGLFVSTLTEQPIGATIAILVLALGSEIADAIPQLHAIHPYLLTHYWLSFGDLLRDPMALDRTVPGLLSAAAYIAIFASAAWARFTSRDVAS